MNECLFAYRNTRVSVKQKSNFLCSIPEGKRAGGALYADNEAPLGVSDVGQVTISLSAVRG